MNYAEWLAVRLALNSLILYLKDEVELIEKLDAMQAGPPLPIDEAKYTPDYILVIDVFHNAHETLSGLSLGAQAGQIVEIYGNNADNAAKTLEYVSTLLSDLSQGRPY